MNPEYHRIKILEDTIESLKDSLKVEKIYSEIDKILDKNKYDHLHDTAVQISRDFLKFVKEHPIDHYTDSDCYDSDDDSDAEIIPVSYDEAEDVRETFGI